MHFLSRKTTGGVLQLNEMIPDITEGVETMRSVQDILKEKHPLAAPATRCTMKMTQSQSDPVR